MIVAVSVFELHIPAGRSLKGKRRVIKSLIERLHHRYRVSVAETAYHDLHQRSQIAVAIVHHSRHDVERLLDSIHELVDQEPGAMLTSWEPYFVEEMP